MWTWFLHGYALDKQNWLMAPKIQDLIAELESADFVNRGGKGSHRNYVHPKAQKAHNNIR